jgi:hypothetical protein
MSLCLREDQKPNVYVEGDRLLVSLQLLLSFPHWSLCAPSLLNLGLHDVLALLEQWRSLVVKNVVCCGRVEDDEEEHNVEEEGPREIVAGTLEQCSR